MLIAAVDHSAPATAPTGSAKRHTMPRTQNAAAPPRTKLLDQVREAIHTRRYSRRTEHAYVGWIRRFIFFHGKRHPGEMGAEAVTRFLSLLAAAGNVAASTQNQALAALLFLYQQVLGQELPWWMGSYIPSARNDCR